MLLNYKLNYYLFSPLCFIKSLYWISSLKMFNNSPSHRIKWSKFLHITLKVFHSLALPTILTVPYFKLQSIVKNILPYPANITLLKLLIPFQMHTS